MGKTLACKDVGVNCDEVIHGKSEAEIMQKAAEHAKGCHQGIKITPELAAKLKAAIRDEAGHGGSGCCGGSGGGSCG